MPSHDERVKENYRTICEVCLKNPVAFFASDTYIGINRTQMCEDCLQIRQEAIERVASQTKA